MAMGPPQAALSGARTSVVPGSERHRCTSGPLFKVSQGLPEVRDSRPHHPFGSQPSVPSTGVRVPRRGPASHGRRRSYLYD